MRDLYNLNLLAKLMVLHCQILFCLAIDAISSLLSTSKFTIKSKFTDTALSVEGEDFLTGVDTGIGLSIEGARLTLICLQ